MQFLALAHEVLDQRERDGVRGVDRERSRFRCHLATAPFATKEIADITAGDIRSWMRLMAQKQALGPGEERKLSRQTVSRNKSLVSTILNEGVDREIIPANVVNVVKDRKRVDESDTKTKWAYLTIDEQRSIDACEAIPRCDRLAILIAIDTGMRQGEQRHLRLSDLDLDGPSPCIHLRVAGRTKDGRSLPPKSGKPRTVPLLPDGVAHFREWLAMLPDFAPSNPHGIVFPTASGTYRQQGKPLGRSDTFRKYLALVGITRRVRWHDLRHTFATNGIILYGWAIEIMQGLMGHSSVQVTQRYSHVGEDTLKSVVRRTAEALTAQAAASAVVEVSAIYEVVEVAPASTAIEVRPAEFRPVEQRSILKRMVGRLFGRSKEVSHVA